MSLFNELKRRNVFKAVVGYIITAWLVMQIALEYWHAKKKREVATIP